MIQILKIAGPTSFLMYLSKRTAVVDKRLLQVGLLSTGLPVHGIRCEMSLTIFEMKCSMGPLTKVRIPELSLQDNVCATHSKHHSSSICLFPLISRYYSDVLVSIK